MNPGVTEEAGKAAQSVVEALKQTPLVLALVIFNLLFIFVVAYVGIKSNERWDKESARWEQLVETAMRACPGTTTREKEP